MMKKKCKHIIMLTGESSCGKTTVRNKIKEIHDSAKRDNFFNFLLKEYDIDMKHRFGIRFGYEYTTRPPRPEEVGKTPEECGYKFVTEEEFETVRATFGDDTEFLVRSYDVITEDGLPATWSYLFVPENEMFTDDDREEICICCSNIDSYLLIRQYTELHTNYTCDAIHMVVPYETLLYRSIAREIEKPAEKQNIQELLRRFSVEHNPGIYTRPFRVNLFCNMRRWLGPSDYIYINNTHVVRFGGSIHEDCTLKDVATVLHTIDTKVYNRY